MYGIEQIVVETFVSQVIEIILASVCNIPFRFFGKVFWEKPKRNIPKGENLMSKILGPLY